MDILQGIGVSSGVAVAGALVISDDQLRIGSHTVAAGNLEAERQKLQAAIAASSEEIRELRDQTSRRLGRETGAIFDFHLGLLNDPELIRTFIDLINSQRYSAEYAVYRALRDYAKIFTDHSDAYFRDRVKDIYDIERRLLSKLTGAERLRIGELTEPVILIASDLTPSQTASLDKTMVRGIAIESGGKTSHTAIIANSLGIPAVVGLEGVTHEIRTGDIIIINGHEGRVIVGPDPITIEENKFLEQRQIRHATELDLLRDEPARTKDGVDITLMANIEFPHEVEYAIRKGAMGIGLYRTEFLYLGSDKPPTEDDHYAAYAEVIRRLAGKPVVIRTLDLGADKYSPNLNLPPEPNPFLGCRSIRLCLASQDMFKVQLRAILRASVLGDVRIMFPMISNMLELRQAKYVLKDVMEDLDEEGIAYNRYIRVGMMVEVPSTALMPKPYVRETDFLSIGSNDLIQYTLAVDRGNQRVASLFTGAHPAVIRLIRRVLRSGRAEVKNVSLCGEMGGDPDYTMLLVGLGLRTLSITPNNIPEIKQLIREITLKQAEKIANKALKMEQGHLILNLLHDEMRRIHPDFYRDDVSKLAHHSQEA